MTKMIGDAGASHEDNDGRQWSMKANLTKLVQTRSTQDELVVDEDQSLVEVTFSGTVQDAIDLADALQDAGIWYGLRSSPGYGPARDREEHDRLAQIAEAQALELHAELERAQNWAANQAST